MALLARKQNQETGPESTKELVYLYISKLNRVRKEVRLMAGNWTQPVEEA